MPNTNGWPYEKDGLLKDWQQKKTADARLHVGYSKQEMSSMREIREIF